MQARPGVTSTIIGARRLEQLEDNVKALDVHLGAEELARLDALTRPGSGFPRSMQPWFPALHALHNGGTTINGVHAEPSPFVMQNCLQPIEPVTACARETLPDAPSGGVHVVCLCAPDGKVFTTPLGGSIEVVGDPCP